MTNIRASDFKTRDALDKKVQSLTKKSGVFVVGTMAELRRLHLSHRTVVWGVPCKATDYKPPNAFKPVNRGEIKPFGINGNLREAPTKKKVIKSKKK